MLRGGRVSSWRRAVPALAACFALGLALGQSQARASGASLGTTLAGTPATSEAKTLSEIDAQGTLAVEVKTAEGLPAQGAMLTIRGSGGGGSGMVPPAGVVSQKLRKGPVTLSATGTPPGSATQVSATAQATVVAGSRTSVVLTLPAGSPLQLPRAISASNSERDIAYLNTERARWGLPADLTLNPRWSQACAAHDAYLAANHLFEHAENSGLPGASPGGAWAGTHSILAGGGGWLAEGNPWENAPIHLDQLYTPDLAVVGIDESRGDACTTTWPGIGLPRQPAGTVITYPGDGASGLPPSERAAESPFVPGKFVGIPETAVAGRELFVYEERGECSFFACSFSAPEIESATLTGPSGPVELRWVAGNTPEIGSLLSGAILLPLKPLAANATYIADVTLAPYEALPAEQHRWTFQTGPANPNGAWPHGSQALIQAGPRRGISKLTVTPAALAARAGGHGGHGARVSYSDSDSGIASFLVFRLKGGVLTTGRCKAPSERATRPRRCSLASRIYSFRHLDRAGVNSFQLTGRLGRQSLAAGKYRLLAIGPGDAPAAIAVFAVK
jgi:hypothetical protein